MSKEKFLNIFSRRMEAIVSIFLQMFFAACAVLKIGQHHPDDSPVLAEGTLGPVPRLDHLRADRAEKLLRMSLIRAGKQGNR